MSELPLLQQLLNAPGAPWTNWREIIKEIDSESGRAITTAYRVALLEIFKSTMDIAETTIAPEDLDKFKEIRLRHYKVFIAEETVVDGNVCIETLNEVTQREIAAGRMAPDDNLRKIAVDGMAAPHLTRAELIESEGTRSTTPALPEATPLSGWRRAFAWILRG